MDGFETMLTIYKLIALYLSYIIFLFTFLRQVNSKKNNPLMYVKNLHTSPTEGQQIPRGKGWGKGKYEVDQ